MPIKGSAAQFLKNLKTKYPTGSSKRSSVSPINSYLTQNEYKLMLPARVKDYVQLKAASSQIEYDCVPLMTLMFSCLKSHNYQEESCQDEIKTFNQCFTDYNIRIQVAEENENKGVYNAEEGQRRYPISLVNKLLSNYKQPMSVDTGPEDTYKKKSKN